jgi:hypothetical protein
MQELEIEVIFVTNDVEQSFTGTAVEIAREVAMQQLIYGSCVYYIPVKVGFITEVE